MPLHIMNADGTGHRRLLDVPVGPFLAWSPDSTRLAFSSGFEDPRLGDPRVMQGLEPHASGVYVADVQTRQLTRVTPVGQSQFTSWSPDGRRIVFSGTEPGSMRPDLYIVDAGGGVPQRIVSSPTSDVQPAWSPRGDQIAYVAAPTAPNSTDSGVFLIRPDGSAPRRISADVAQRATWSPDPRFILIAGRTARLVDTTTDASIEVGSV